MIEFKDAFIVVSEACKKIGLERPSFQYNGEVFHAIGWYKDSVYNLCGRGETPELAAKDLIDRFEKEKKERVEKLKIELEKLENE